MSNSTDGARSVIGAPGARAAAVRLALSAAALTAVFAAAASVAATADIAPFARIGLAACAAIAAIFFALILARARGGSDPAEAFRSLFGSSREAWALTDEDGRLISENEAFRRLSPGEGDTKLIGDAFAGASGESESVAFRLIRRAGELGEASEIVSGPAGIHCIEASRVAGTALLWSASPAPSTRDQHAGAAYAYSRISLSGAVVAENERFAALDAQDRAAAVALATGEGSELELTTGATISALRHRSAEGVDLFLAGAVQDFMCAGSLFDELPVALLWLTSEGRVIDANEAATNLLGVSPDAGDFIGDIVEGLGRPISARISESWEGRGVDRADLARRHTDGVDRYLRIGFRPTRLAGVHGLMATLSDATQLKELEQQFVQSQKMQAVGQLAGGVAHDFNNLLTAILGHCDLLAMRRDSADPDFEDLSQIRQNANRAAGLVRQLLAFSRQQKLNPRSCALPDILNELSHLLNRLIGERVALEIRAEHDLWRVWIDERQIEQVIVNLVVNAKDAMPEGGVIRIACRNETLNEEIRRDRAVVPVGDYVRISLRDEGSGMDEDTQAKVFEPFFTTKGQGEGTGLGLSTVYGIVKQTGGFIFINSAPGDGAEFDILIPRLADERAAETVVVAPAVKPDLTGSGRILLVEDEGPVRAFARRALDLRGYQVIEAEDATEALDALGRAEGTIDLIVSDVVMPGRDGPSWVREARETHPDVPVIFTSGYDEAVFQKGIDDLGNCGFLAKPFSLDDLAVAVKSRLGAGHLN